MLEQSFDLINQQVNPISKIEWWLLKYSDCYGKTFDFVHSQNLQKQNDGLTIQLPSLGEPTNQEKFLDLYKALEVICEFHRYEKYFKQEITEYNKITDSQLDLNKWIEKNVSLGADKYACFHINYLNYSENPEHLNIYVPTFSELEIYINRSDFKSTIKFLEIFEKLYWK